MNRLIVFFFSLICSASCLAGNVWQTCPTSSAIGGASYNCVMNFIAVSDFSIYKVYVSDQILPAPAATSYDYTVTSSIQIKDSSNNNICSTPVSNSHTFGSLTIYSFEQDCSSGTLTSGNTYTVNISGTAYHVQGMGTSTVGAPNLSVFLFAQ